MEKLSIKVCLVLFIIFGISIVKAEEYDMMSIDRFIKTSDTDAKLLNLYQLTTYLKNAPSSTPYIDRLEFRTKTDEFDLDKQQYSLRFSPKGLGETYYTREVNKLENASYITEEMNYYNNALKQRYTLVLDYLETQMLISLNNDLTVICEDRIMVLKKQSTASISFDISDLIAAEEELTGLRLELVEFENNITGLTNQIAVAANSQVPIGFDKSSLMDISSIEKEINEFIFEADANNIKLLDQKNKMDLANSKYKLEQAQNRNYLSYVEVTYDRDNYDEPKKAYSLELAIKLPFIHPDRDEVNMKKMSYLEEMLQYTEEKEALYEKKLSQTLSINRLIKQYALLASNKENSNAEVSYRAYLQMEGIDPLNLLKIKESIIKSDIQLIKTEYNIRHRFIEIMDIMGKLFQKPFKNYLVK